MALHSRRTVLKGVTTSAVVLAGCTGIAYRILIAVSNNTENTLSATVSFAEDELLDGHGEQWTLDLDADEARELWSDGGGRNGG